MDLEKALKINPQVENAQKYLDDIKMKHPEALKGPPSIGYGAGRQVPPPRPSEAGRSAPINPTHPDQRRAVSPSSEYKAALQRELAAAVEEKKRKKRERSKSKSKRRKRKTLKKRSSSSSGSDSD